MLSRKKTSSLLSLCGFPEKKHTIHTMAPGPSKSNIEAISGKPVSVSNDFYIY